MQHNKISVMYSYYLCLKKEKKKLGLISLMLNSKKKWAISLCCRFGDRVPGKPFHFRLSLLAERFYFISLNGKDDFSSPLFFVFLWKKSALTS